MKSLVIIPLLAACTHDIESYKPLDVQTARKLDVLFVLDDSADRARYDQMAQQLGDLTAGLTAVDGSLPSLHVGVVTSDLGTSSTDDRAPLRPVVSGCFGYGKDAKLQTFGAGITGAFLSDERDAAGGRMQNFSSGNLAAELAKLTNPTMPAAGCEFEQPLEAMRRALDPATNPGFIREDAMLAVVFLTNEDDCSLKTGALLEPLDTSLGALSSYRCTRTGVVCDGDNPNQVGDKANCRPRADSRFVVDVAEYEAFLAGFKKDRKDIIVSAVAGPRDPFIVWDFGGPVLKESCAGAAGSAVPAVRLGALVDSFGGAIVNGCTQESAYTQIATPIVNRQRSCFSTLQKTEEPNCAVVEVSADTETELDRCADGDAGPCWYSFEDAVACPDGDNLGIGVRRNSAMAAGNRLEARCFVK